MNFKRIITTSIILICCIGSVFAIDYSKYKYEQFTAPKNNPAYLVMPCGKASESSLVKIEGNKWVVPLGPFWYVTLSQSLLDKIIKAKNDNDNFILFYQRKGSYVDISKYTGTNDPDLIRRDNKGQLEYIEATAKSYTFVADDILTYSEIMTGISEDMSRILLEEENRGNDYNDEIRNPIFLAFVKGQMNGARNYINSRIKAIETANAQAQAEKDAQVARKVAEEQKRLEERIAAENRANTLKTAMIMDYKPCFNIGGSNNETPYELYPKIAVVGYLENRYNSFGDEFTVKPVNFNHDQRDSLRLISTTSLTALVNLFLSIVKKDSYGSMNSYYCISFLTKTNENIYSNSDTYKKYKLDSYIVLDNIVDINNLPAGSSMQTSLEEWILNNNGKQNIQFLNTVAAITEIKKTAQQQNSSLVDESSTKKTSTSKAVIQEPAKQESTANKTVNGYEPCFNIGGNPEPTPYKGFTKIIVVGYFYNSYDNNYQIRTYNYNHYQKESIILSVSSKNRDVFKKIKRQGYTSDSYYCIFFLSKLKDGKYTVDNFTDYGEIIGKDKNNIYANDISKSVLEEWIVQNHDK
jgi:hypothetical protein